MTIKKSFIFVILLSSLVFPLLSSAQSQLDRRTEDGVSIPFVDMTVRSPEGSQETAFSLQILLLLAILTISPSILILCTGFIRIAIVLDFIKRALALQQVPPNQVLMGIALFLTAFVMWPTLSEIYEEGFKPFEEGIIGVEELYEKAENPLRIFMYKQMAGNHDTIAMFMNMTDLPRPNNLSDVPTYVLVPSFVLNELSIAFKIGILIYLPFIVIDLVVSSVLMSMGMIMLPPVMISMPFKLALFILVDGWSLITQQLMISFS